MLLAPLLDEQSTSPYYIQLYEYFKHEIIAENLTAGTRLPSLRKLAEQLNISTTPIELAYQQLLAEGFIESRAKSGYYVQALHPIYQRTDHHWGQTGQMNQAAARAITARDPHYYRYDFHISKNDFSIFPYRIWKNLLQEHLANPQLLQYGDPQGEPALRQSIATYLRQFRGLRCTAEQVVIGADQYILASLLSLLLKNHSGNRIGIEDPGYHLLPATFLKHGYEVVPIPLQEDGLCIDHLYSSKAKVVYTSPSHQFPRGITMPIQKRMQLLEWAKQTDGFIIENDDDGEFRYHGRPIPSVQGMVKDAPVIYLGGFSQVIAPALCIHYMVLPKFMLYAYHQLKWDLYLEHSASRLNQIALHHFFEKGYFDKHLRKMRLLYRRKHDQMIQSIQQHMGDRAVVTGKDAGFHLMLKIEHERSEAELVQLAKEAGVRIAPMSFTWWGKDKCDEHGIVPKVHEFIVGFGGIDEDNIDDGIRTLKEVWFD
ncbi:MocR-like pyridoxine biosynthesis transcription factor PdxR [Paenibacillus sp. 481]|uniref:MocR-like pyridoxine biosynthesis transcription factor PdxR n=1 Tax=Paenibacillus sp. 481 TaxID=2835869 RepID=UPI001E4AEDF1|nr:PLP-dependent aminotransferase family protein [Paenibacillus sp. 481]UHA75119.1 PLP-dependent aminotransferase family protein [Paenibacillus sp. 481]